MERMRPPIVPEKPVPVLTEGQLRALLASARSNSFVDRLALIQLHNWPIVRARRERRAPDGLPGINADQPPKMRRKSGGVRSYTEGLPTVVLGLRYCRSNCPDARVSADP